MAVTDHRARTSTPHRWGLLAVSLLAVAVVSVVGSLATDTGPDSWYATLEQPPWSPPDAAFGPVWTVLYLAMAVAAWLVARHGLDRRDVRAALGLYGAQLTLNLSWSLVFFGLESVWGGVLVIGALWLGIVASASAFARIETIAAWLLVPYLAWVSYATALNVAIWWLS
jgi:translocator protein